MKILKKAAVILTAALTMGGIVNMPISQGKMADTAITANAASYGDFEYSICTRSDISGYNIDGTCIISKYNGSAETVTIPSTINGIKVGVIGDSAFKGNTKIKKVVLPDTVIDIQCYAFQNCTNLESINTPDSLRIVRSSAFENCTSLKAFNFNKIEIVGWYILKSCKSITDIYVSGTLKRVGIGSFEQCTNLRTLTFAEGVEIIDAYVGLDTPALEKITIAESVEEISRLALCYATYHFKYDDGTSGTSLVPDIDNIKEYNFVPGSAAEQYGIDIGILEVFEHKVEVETPLGGMITQFPTISKGDINSSGAVDSSDASMVLAEYSAVQTGNGASFTEAQNKAADVNFDDVVDASDASEILRYYAEASTGKNPSWNLDLPTKIDRT